MKKSGVRCSGRRASKWYCRCLEGEIHAGADHAEVIVWATYEVPAEITDPTDMRRKADFHAAADLANSFCLTVRMTNRLDNVEAFSRFSKSLVDLPLATAKDPAASAENIW